MTAGDTARRLRDRLAEFLARERGLRELATKGGQSVGRSPTISPSVLAELERMMFETDALVRESEVMPSDPTRMHLQHDHRSSSVPSPQHGDSAIAGEQHPATNTARAIQPAAEPLPPMPSLRERIARLEDSGISAGEIREWLIECFELTEVELARLRVGATPAQEWQPKRGICDCGHAVTEHGEKSYGNGGCLIPGCKCHRSRADVMRAGAPAPPQEPTK